MVSVLLVGDGTSHLISTILRLGHHKRHKIRQFFHQQKKRKDVALDGVDPVKKQGGSESIK